MIVTFVALIGVPLADWLFSSLRLSFGTLIVHATEPDRCDSVLDFCRSYNRSAVG